MLVVLAGLFFIPSQKARAIHAVISKRVDVVLLAFIKITLNRTYRYIKDEILGYVQQPALRISRYTMYHMGNRITKDVYYTNFSNNLRYGTLVTIYYTVPMAKRLGYGIIRNSSPEEYIEIEILYVEDEFSEIFNQSKTNNRKVLRHMYVLPNTYFEELDTITTLLKGGDSSDGKK